MTAASPPAPVPPERAQLLLFVGAALRPEPALGQALARAGWRCVWLATVDAALRAAAHAHFDAVLWQAEATGGPPARQIGPLRRALHCPVLVRADEVDEVDEILALEFGADAYLAGALAPRRLRAHLQALTRRNDDAEGLAAATPASPPITLGAWTLDVEQQRLEGDGDERPVGLTALQCALLHCLGAQAGRVVPRAVLAQCLGHGRVLHARSVDVYVARLRRRLREHRVDGMEIEGVRGRGYTLNLMRVPAVDPLRHWVSQREFGGAFGAAPPPLA
jgi:two-component system phosphate regulon response regulator OmpR